MQILQFRSPPIPHRFHPHPKLAGNIAAIPMGEDLHLYDVLHPEEPVKVATDVRGYALHPSVLVTQDRRGVLARGEEHAGAWIESAVLPIPSDITDPRAPLRIQLSASGRYLALVAQARAYVLNAETGHIIYSIALTTKSFGGMDFAQLPTGEEILFLSAPDFSSVQVIDCASGQVRNEYRAKSPGHGFIHKSYDLSPDGTRLYTEGEYWGGPWWGILYDFRPWLANEAGSPDPSSHLPGIYLSEDLAARRVRLSTHLTRTADGAMSILSLVEPGELSAEDLASQMEYAETLNAAEGACLDACMRIPAERYGLAVLRVDVRTGKTLGSVVAPIAKTDESHIHILNEHQVLLVNEHLQIFDGLTGVVSDLCPFSPPDPYYRTIASPDGAALVVWSEERPSAT